MLALPILPLLLWSSPAHAEQHGLVVRLETGGEPMSGQAFILLTPTGGEVTRVEVKNDGVAPDVSAGDGTWSGSLWLDGDAFTVGLEANGKTVVGGTVSWNPDDAARDLSVSLQGDTIVVEAGVSAAGNTGGPTPGDGGTPSEGSPPAEGGGTPPEGGTPSVTPSSGGTPPGGGTPPSSGGPVNASARTGGSDDGTLYIGFGLGVLVLVGVAWLWLRNRPAEGGSGGPPSGVTVVPEPGLLGPGTPSLSDGLGLWVVAEADQDALVAPLLATLARHHRVLFAAPTRIAAPSVYGGPVYRATNTRPSHVGDAAEALQRDGGAVAVLFVGTGADAATVRDYADLLPTGVGSICVVTQDPGVPALSRVNARREGGAWIVSTGDRTLRLVEGRDGFEEARGPA